METNDKTGWKKLKTDAKAEDANSTHTGSGTEAPGEDKDNTKPAKAHSSQGHTTDAKGTATNMREPTLRSATTDSSRSPKNNNDEGPTGGNIR